ncbi:MAG: D-alanine--D-alanine ligase [Synergistaceae bacterium]|jgi:D-alanine-D-alanine ligase|nr:D-alanine--D-alanine ligase [Synergistaceae bacterium]
MKIRVGVFFGGRSVEHEVSIISAMQAIAAFDRTKYDVVPVYITKNGDLFVGEHLDKIEKYRDIPSLLKKSQRVFFHRDGDRFLLVQYPMKRFGSSVRAEIDVAFPITHGTNVEDGALQGYLKVFSIPFVGCDVTASAVGMDKYLMKALCKENGLPVLNCSRVYMKAFYGDKNGTITDVEGSLPYPAIVKPVNLGSSVGIRRVGNTQELMDALGYAFQFADTALVEPAIQNLREINCSVLGDRESAMASECEEPINYDAILSYEDKYLSGGKTKGMSAAKRKLPADISLEVRQRVRELAVETFQLLGCNGVTRIDFLMNASSGEIWINEINTIPGSLSFYLWEPVGMPFTRLLDELVRLAFKRRREEAEIVYSFDANILAQFEADGIKSGIKNGIKNKKVV